MARVPYQRRDEEWQVALRRVLDLAPGDRLKVYAALRDDLGGVLGKESERERQARLRFEAREAMRAAASVLGLPGGQAPTVTEYKEAARQATLPMTFNAVYEAFERRWEIAQRFYRGDPVPATAGQRSARRGVLGSSRGRYEDPVAGLRQFLLQDPPPVSTGLADYEAWAKEENDRRSASEPRLIEKANHLRTSLRVTWESAKAVARREKTIEDARRERLDELLADSGPLVGGNLAAWMLDKTPSNFEKYRQRQGFPRPVARLSGGPLWRRSDIEGWRDGKRDFTDEEGALQGEVVDSAEIAERVGLPDSQMRNRVYEERWDLVPKPAGKAARRVYWLSEDVERWLAAR